MPRSIVLVFGVLLAGSLAACGPPSTLHATNSTAAPATPSVDNHLLGEPAMRLGNFSVSLAVKDIVASREFYEKLGFTMINGDGKKWGRSSE